MGYEWVTEFSGGNAFFGWRGSKAQKKKDYINSENIWSEFPTELFGAAPDSNPETHSDSEDKVLRCARIRALQRTSNQRNATLVKVCVAIFLKIGGE